jgi:hypothetical protein
MATGFESFHANICAYLDFEQKFRKLKRYCIDNIPPARKSKTNYSLSISIF